MFEFNGTLSQEVSDSYRAKMFAKKKKNGILISILVTVTLILAILFDLFVLEDKTPFPNLLFKDWLLFFVILFVVGIAFLIVSFNAKNIKFEDSFLIRLSEDKIIYEPKQAFARRELDSSNLSKILDCGAYYVLLLKNKDQFVLEKKLLKNATIKEFENFFESVLVRNSEAKIVNDDEGNNTKIANKTDDGTFDEPNTNSSKKLSKDLNDNEQDVAVVADDSIKDLDEKDSETIVNVNTENAESKKFKKTLNRDEKSFKFAILGIVLGIIALVLSIPVAVFGLNFAFNIIADVANFFFSGFVIEFFSFVFAIIAIIFVSVGLVAISLLATPVLALLSLIFPIYQLARVNRRWFSWVALVFGILTIIGCIILVFVGVGFVANG